MKGRIHTNLTSFVRTHKIGCYVKPYIASLAASHTDRRIFDILHVGGIIKSLRTTTSLFSKAYSLRHLEYLASTKSKYMTAQHKMVGKEPSGIIRHPLFQFISQDSSEKPREVPDLIRIFLPSFLPRRFQMKKRENVALLTLFRKKAWEWDRTPRLYWQVPKCRCDKSPIISV